MSEYHYHENHSYENHSHEIHDYNKAFAYGIALNIIYMIIEVLFGLSINSMALIADAGHNLSDILGLILAWGASFLAKSSPTQTHTYGLRKSTILAAFLNAIILLTAIGAILVESIRRFMSPEPVQGLTMMAVAGIGVIVNAITAVLFIKGKEKDINIKGAYLHMAADAGISLGVVAAGLLILLTGWIWLDPVISIVIVIVITIGTWSLLKDSFHLSMDAVPRDLEAEQVNKYLRSLPGVTEVHDLHIWAMSTTEAALTVHLVKDKTVTNNEILAGICRDLHDKFGIEHTTIQLEDDNSLVMCKGFKV